MHILGYYVRPGGTELDAMLAEHTKRPGGKESDNVKRLQEMGFALSRPEAYWLRQKGPAALAGPMWPK